MKASFKIGFLLVLIVCEVRNSLSLPTSSESSVVEPSDVETENLNEDVDLILKSLAETLPSELNLDSADENCTLQGLRNGVKRQGDAAVTKVSEDKVILSFDFSMDETQVRCVPRKEEEENSPAPVLLRPSWWTRTRNKVVKTVKKYVVPVAVKALVATVVPVPIVPLLVSDLKVVGLDISEPSTAGVSSRPEDDALLKKVVDAKDKISNELETALSGKLKAL
ncbi:uncharacterized protein [Palaemon carinicauda]|uniref:uncharacterized protein n=1 Tax=Palaemon carinicauda TaxID=392227 RepID=UPI0035B5738B